MIQEWLEPIISNIVFSKKEKKKMVLVSFFDIFGNGSVFFSTTLSHDFFIIIYFPFSGINTSLTGLKWRSIGKLDSYSMNYI